MLKSLFSSTTRIKILTLFFTNPGKDFYLREIHRLLKIAVSAIQKELENLEQINLITSYKRGNIKYYQINTSHIIYPELKSIIYKTEAVGETIRSKLQEIGDIQVALIFGSVAKGKEKAHSDIDLLIIGNPNADKLYQVIGEIETNLRREINFVMYSPDEWQQKVVSKSSFAIDILNNKVIPLIGDLNKL